MALTTVVLPTPGPPVITRTLEASASATADLWLSAKTRPVRCSIQGIAFSASIQGQGSLPVLSCSSRDAAFRPVQGGPENARLVADRVGNDRTVSQFEVEGRADQLLRDFEKPFGQRQ